MRLMTASLAEEFIETLGELEPLTEEAPIPAIDLHGEPMFHGLASIISLCQRKGVSVATAQLAFGEKRCYHVRHGGQQYGPFDTEEEAWADAFWVHGFTFDE